MYLKEIPGYLQQLEEVIAAKQSDTLKLSAHKLRGSSDSLGLTGIVKICQQLENAAEQKDFILAQRIMNTLTEVMKKAKAELESLRD